MAFSNEDTKVPIRGKKSTKFKKPERLTVVFWEKYTGATRPWQLDWGPRYYTGFHIEKRKKRAKKVIRNAQCWIQRYMEERKTFITFLYIDYRHHDTVFLNPLVYMIKIKVVFKLHCIIFLFQKKTAISYKVFQKKKCKHTILYSSFQGSHSFPESHPQTSIQNF